MSQEDYKWQDDAKCAQVGGDLWFPEKGEKAKEAKNLCMSCKVRAQCLDYALKSADLHFGIFAGLTPTELRAERRKRNLEGGTLPEDIEPEDPSVYE